MRVLVAAVLLFFNVAFVLWMVFGDGPRADQATVPATDPGIAALVLLSERAPGGVSEDSASSAPAEPVASAAKPDAEPGGMWADAAAPSSPSAAEPLPPQAPISAHRPEEVTAAVRPPGESTAVGQPQQPAGEPEAVEAPPGPPAETSVATDARPPAEVCHLVGPYLDRRVAQVAAEPFAAEEVEAVVLEEAVVEPRYWVYLPPFVNRSAAFERERELRARGVEDVQVLAGDGKENGISLGLYREPTAAARRLRQLRGLGFAPRMDVIERSRPQFWLQLKAIGAVGSEPSWIAGLLAADPALESRPCDRESEPR